MLLKLFVCGLEGEKLKVGQSEKGRGGLFGKTSLRQHSKIHIWQTSWIDLPFLD